jgi:3-phosphoshikimate 1-carboxyvinyltransferase
MREIKPHKINSCRVTVPGSKSYTHRMLIAAALSDGICTIKNALVSEDTRFTIEPPCDCYRQWRRWVKEPIP